VGSGRNLRIARRELDDSEVSLARDVRELRNALAHSTSSRFVFSVLEGAFQSSPAALEAMIRKLVERRRSMDAEYLLEPEGSDELISGVDASKELIPEPAFETLKEVMLRFETMARDSKLTAFRDILLRLMAESPASRRVCVATTRAATAFYLSAELENLKVAHSVIHGGVRTQEREDLLAEFAHGGSVLITTMVEQTSEALREVTDLLLYDLPNNAPRVRQFLGQFNRLGRTVPLDIYLFTPHRSESEVAPYSAQSLGAVFEVATSDPRKYQ
jgi:hypothetical protein